MSQISYNRIPQVIVDFIEKVVIPVSPNETKFLLYTISPYILRNVGKSLEPYKQKLTMFGIMNEQEKIDIELLQQALNTAIDKVGFIQLYGIKFTQPDVSALIQIINNYKD